MKICTILFLLVLNYVLFSQNEEEDGIASSTKFGLLGGINFSSTSDMGKSFLFEWKISLSRKFSTKLSVGYYTASISDKYIVKTFDFVSINNIERYYAVLYEVYKKEYQLIPLAVGMQYFLSRSIFSPYTLVEFGYNLIDPNVMESRHTLIGEYNLYNELPDDHKNKHKEILPNDSYAVGLGIGTTYEISAIVNLDLRYLYKIDSEKINNHQVLIGISF